MTPSVDFTTEAASPPIEISKLDTVLDDIAAEITNSLAADGQTAPTADIPLNGHKLTGVGAPTALTDAVTATTVIDQELQYYVDSGSANTYVITPSPAIAAYEEGQRFVVRIANASSGASTLNVNGLGAIAIQTADATAVASGTLAAGGIYEFTYDANTSPDRWVVTSPTSKIPDGMLSSNVPLLNAANSFTAGQTISVAVPFLRLSETDQATDTKTWNVIVSGSVFSLFTATDAGTSTNSAFRVLRTGTTVDEFEINATTLDFNGAMDVSGTSLLTGAVTAATIANSTSTTLVAGQLHFITGNATLPNLTAGQWIDVINDSASPIDISKHASDTAYWTASGASATTFTLAARGRLSAVCTSAGNVVYVSGNITAAS